jgi:hypothetical protein
VILVEEVIDAVWERVGVSEGVTEDEDVAEDV